MHNRSVTVLIADDDPEIRRLIAETLKAEGFGTLQAADGEEAVALLASQAVQLIIMDVMMPRTNGLMATVKIRERSNVPILMLSARSEQDDRVLGLGSGADDYLTKPFYGAELIARVQSLLRRYLELGSAADQRDNGVLSYYDLRLDPAAKKLTVRGEAVRLTATEYKIVRLLLGRPGQVFSAEEIYEAVWNTEAYAVENTVMIHISRIREKIEINPKKPEYLKVVWGIGYKIEKE